MTAGLFVSFTHSQPEPWLTVTLWLETQKCWNVFLNITIGNAWLLRYTILPHHLHCQTAWIGHHALQGQVVNLREGHRAQSRRGQSHSVSLMSEQSSIWGECWKIGLSLPTSAFTPAVSGRGQGHVQCRGTQFIARVGLPCQSVQGTKVRVYLCRGTKLPLTAELSFCWVLCYHVCFTGEVYGKLGQRSYFLSASSSLIGWLWMHKFRLMASVVRCDH